MTAVRELRLARARIPVVPPRLDDVRLKQSVVIASLQVLGQVALGFKVSLSQIIVTIVVCAAIEVAVTAVRQHVLAWPGSALLTGNSVAFILRASGTEHGDWWSFHGIHLFVLAAVLSMLSKLLVKPSGDRHVFNPSNIGLVWTLLVIGPGQVYPQYLWWGPSRIGTVLAYGIIAAGAVWILGRVGMVGMAVSFMVTFGALVGLAAVSGRTFIAIWRDDTIGGLSYWTNIVLSPEVLIFVFFMMSDPRTAPRHRRGRVVYGSATAVVAAGLLSVQSTEFGVKLSILASLTVVCALVPLIDRLTAPAGPARLARPRPTPAVLRRAVTPAVLAAAVIAVAAPLNTASLADDEQLILIERGLAGPNAQ